MTESTLSCDMVRVADRQAVHDGPPGAFCFEQRGMPGARYRVLWHKLPEGTAGFLRLRPLPASEEAHPSWTFNGDEDRPTLHPSVHYVGHWHGYFTAGRMVSG